MAKTAGGVRTYKQGSSRASKGATEKGYTAKMVKNIVGMEQKYRRNKIHQILTKGETHGTPLWASLSFLYDYYKIRTNDFIRNKTKPLIQESA